MDEIEAAYLDPETNTTIVLKRNKEETVIKTRELEVKSKGKKASIKIIWANVELNIPYETWIKIFKNLEKTICLGVKTESK